VSLYDQINQFGQKTVFKNVQLNFKMVKTADKTLTALHDDEIRLGKELLQEQNLQNSQSPHKEIRG
jgi:hypothetical protein